MLAHNLGPLEVGEEGVLVELTLDALTDFLELPEIDIELVVVSISTFYWLAYGLEDEKLVLELVLGGGLGGVIVEPLYSFIDVLDEGHFGRFIHILYQVTVFINFLAHIIAVGFQGIFHFF